MIKKILLLTIMIFMSLPAFSSEIEFTKEGKGIYTFKIPLREYKNKIKPYVSNKLKTTSDVYKENDFLFAANGGYFDIKTGNDVSSVIIDKKVVCDLGKNKTLQDSLEESKRLEPVLNRSELRIYEDKKGDLSFDIVNHCDDIPKGKEILHSIQAGPMILPELKLEEESFIKCDKNKTISLAADVLKRRERTVVGLKEGLLSDDLYIIIFSNTNKVTLNEAKEYCEKLKLDKALNMDGGASTSFNYQNYEIFSDSGNERRVKSFIVIEK